MAPENLNPGILDSVNLIKKSKFHFRNSKTFVANRHFSRKQAFFFKKKWCYYYNF